MTGRLGLCCLAMDNGAVTHDQCTGILIDTKGVFTRFLFIISFFISLNDHSQIHNGNAMICGLIKAIWNHSSLALIAAVRVSRIRELIAGERRLGSLMVLDSSAAMAPASTLRAAMNALRKRSD